MRQGAYMGQVAGGGLRSRLLVGVATVALAAPVAGKALAQAPDKWQPFVEGGVLWTNDHGLGDVDIFLPLWQDQSSLFFGDLRGQFTTQDVQEGSFGLGYRTLIDPEWILGGYAFFDIQHSKEDNLFYQASVGAELLSVDWDFRVNGYFPLNGDSGDKNRVGGNNVGGLQIFGTTIGFKEEQEKAPFGVDGEVRWRVPIFPADGDIGLRVVGGGRSFGAW